MFKLLLYRNRNIKPPEMNKTNSSLFLSFSVLFNEGKKFASFPAKESQVEVDFSIPPSASDVSAVNCY
jgi:hypothetical protein